MQQLLGERVGAMDGAILKELFMQRLPTNVMMVLASASERTPLKELATMADKILEVAMASIATVSAPSRATSELEQLRTENTSLQEQISPCRKQQGLDGVDRAVKTEANPVLLHKQSAGITADSVTKLGSGLCCVRKRETGRPANNGD